MPTDDDFEPSNTPINEAPLAGLERRQRETLSCLDQIGTELKAQTERDVREHASLNAGLDSLNLRHTKHGEQLDAISVHVGDLRAATARMEGSLGGLVKLVDAQQQVAVKREIVHIETEATVERLRQEDEVDERKAARQHKLKVVGILGTIATAISGLVTLLATQCS